MTDPTDTLPMKEILTAAGPLIKTVIDTFIAPKLVKLKERLHLDYNKNYVLTEEHFSEYFHRTYKRVSIVNTLVFNNSQRFLKEIYLPLTLVRKKAKGEAKYKINSFPTELLKRYEKVLITDNAGMGKSTLAKKMFLDTIDEKRGIPLLIELRRLSKDKPVIAEIQEQINSLKKDFDDKLMLELLAQGGFVILLDGYDEIPLSDREAVTIDLQTFIAKAQNNIFIMTSRPENALKGFGDFLEIKIEPLKKKEAFELLRKYDKQGQISNLLIKKLEEIEMTSISEFLTNPLLVSLLFTAFQHKQTIPFKKHIFYRQVYDANFESHDLTKGDSYTRDKHCHLEIDDFHRVLRHVGFSCLRDNQRIEFNKDEILNLIRNAKMFCVDLSFKESDFLNDMLSTVPLFTQDGNYYRWAHKSLQEYFAAQFIYLDIKEQQSKILLQLYNSPSLDKFINILDLYYDIDTKTFRSTILFTLLSSFLKHLESAFQDLHPSIRVEEIEMRKELSFLTDSYMLLMPSPSFQPEDFNIVLKKIDFNKRSTASIYVQQVSDHLYCLICKDVKYQLCMMLSQKLPKVFIKEDHLPTHSNVQIVHNLQEFYEPHIISDASGDQFNTSENFANVNKVLRSSRLFSTRIDSREARKLFEQITEQIATESRESFSLDTD